MRTVIRIGLVVLLTVMLLGGCSTLSKPGLDSTHETKSSLNVDADGNSALDVTYGGTNSATAADARAAINAQGEVATYAALRAYSTANLSSGDVMYAKAGATAGDGLGGVFRLVTGAAAGTYTDDGASTLLPTGGDGSIAWLLEGTNFASARIGTTHFAETEAQALAADSAGNIIILVADITLTAGWTPVAALDTNNQTITLGAYDLAFTSCQPKRLTDGCFNENGVGAVSGLNQDVFVDCWGTNDAAFANAHAATSGEILLQGKSYTISAGIVSDASKPLKIRGASSEYSIIQGTGITIIQFLSNNCVLKNLKVFQSAANASTVGLEIQEASNWILEDVIFQGAFVSPYVGTGIALNGALKGNIKDCYVLYWGIGIDHAAYGGIKSNANRIDGCKIRQNMTGVRIQASGCDSIFMHGNTLESNDTVGMTAADGLIALQGNHFENSDADQNLILSDIARYAGIGNYYYGANVADISVTDGSEYHTSIGENLPRVNNDGTGAVLIQNSRGMISIAGTGYTPIKRNDLVYTTAGLTLTAAQSGTTFYLNTGHTATYNLPVTQLGLEYTFAVPDANGSTLRINPQDTEIVVWNQTEGDAGEHLTINTTGALVKVECILSGRWNVTYHQGVPVWETP